jgi:phosphoglycolate phosphatase
MAMLACADDGFPNKPAPDPVLRICERLGVEPARTAVVGDSPADLRMGRAAGAGRVIAVLTGVGDQATLAPLCDVVLPSIEALTAN